MGDAVNTARTPASSTSVGLLRRTHVDIALLSGDAGSLEPEELGGEFVERVDVAKRPLPGDRLEDVSSRMLSEHHPLAAERVTESLLWEVRGHRPVAGIEEHTE
ncbi:MAG: hypothetical protein ACXVPL_11915, partial [Actinomycetota bacterium]